MTKHIPHHFSVYCSGRLAGNYATLSEAHDSVEGLVELGHSGFVVSVGDALHDSDGSRVRLVCEETAEETAAVQSMIDDLDRDGPPYAGEDGALHDVEDGWPSIAVRALAGRTE